MLRMTNVWILKFSVLRPSLKLFFLKHQRFRILALYEEGKKLDKNQEQLSEQFNVRFIKLFFTFGLFFIKSFTLKFSCVLERKITMKNAETIKSACSVKHFVRRQMYAKVVTCSRVEQNKVHHKGKQQLKIF